MPATPTNPVASPLVAAGSLTGTMIDPERVMREAYERLMAGLTQAQQEAETTYQTRTTAANAALERYLEEANRPMAPYMPAGAILPLALANLSSAWSKNPTYSRQAEQALDYNREDMLRRRSISLQKLMVQYQAQADAAERTGQFAESLKQNQKVLSLTKTYEQTMDLLEQHLTNQRKLDDRAWEAKRDEARFKHEDWQTRYREQHEDLRARMRQTYQDNPMAKAELDAAEKEYTASVNALQQRLSYMTSANETEDVAKQRRALEAQLDQAQVRFRSRITDIQGRYGMGVTPAPATKTAAATPGPAWAQQMYLRLLSDPQTSDPRKLERWLRKRDANSPSGKTNEQVLQEAGVLDAVRGLYAEHFRPTPKAASPTRPRGGERGAPADVTWTEYRARP